MNDFLIRVPIASGESMTYIQDNNTTEEKVNSLQADFTTYISVTGIILMKKQLIVNFITANMYKMHN